MSEPAAAPDTRNPARRGRWIALAVAAFALASVSIVALTGRIRAFNAAHDFTQPLIRLVDSPTFVWRGYPVSITGDFDEQGEGAVTVTYGAEPQTHSAAPPVAAAPMAGAEFRRDAQSASAVPPVPAASATTIRIPVAVPLDIPLPLLARVEDWFRVLQMVEPLEGETVDELYRRTEAGETADRERLIIVTRRPNPGVDATRYRVDDNWAWGETQRSNWVFTFYELTADGEITSQEKRFPDSPTRRMYDKAGAEIRGEPPPPPADDELAERSWQYYAALRVIPPGKGPKSRFEDSALTVSGWTLPTAVGSMLVFALAVAFAAAPERRRW